MTRGWFRSTIGLFLLLVVTLPLSAGAQSPSREVVVLQSGGTDQGAGKGMLVRSYFSLRDGSGNPIIKADVKLQNTGTVALIGDGQGARATITDPDTPIKIVLLLDASGSMAPNIAKAKAAALKALAKMPKNAQLFIYQFTVLEVNAKIGTATDFSTDRAFWQQEVNAWTAKPKAGTCLYNAAFQAVQLLAEAAQPEERRAVILFTDGVDELSGGAQCSERGVGNAISKAKDFHVPIYTIGLCEAQSCNRIDEVILKQLARDTQGDAVVGVVDEIEARFQTIMAILDSQWMAQATLYPHQGQQTATLSVLLEGETQPVSGNFVVEAAFDYDPPPRFNPTISYDKDKDRYALNLDAVNVNALGSVTVTIFDKGQGTLQTTLPIALASLTQTLPIGAETFLAGHEYCFQVRATNRENQPFELGPDELVRGADAKILAAPCVKYEPNLSVTIASVTAQWATKKLLIQLALSGVGQRQLLFDGTITSKAGSKVADISHMAPNADGLIQLDMPLALFEANEKDEFTVQIRTEASGQTKEGSRSFSVIPPPGPDWRWPIGFGVLLLAVLGGGGWLVARRLGAQPEPLRPPLEPELTAKHDAPPPPPPPVRPSRRPMQLRIRVIQTPNPTQKLTVTAKVFPFLIGRGEKDTQLRILGDNGLSRQHIQILQWQHDLCLKDLKSGNGTFINDKQIDPDQPVPIKGRMQVRLGPNTIIEIDPQ